MDACARPVRILIILLAVVFGLVGAASAQGTASAARPVVPEVAITGPIGPATSRYVSHALEDAAEREAPLVILRLDTPGGLDTAMREIVQTVLASPVPVAGFVGPSGARAASAGTYILYATHIATMAPATNLGAATPVNIGGDSPSQAAQDEAESDDDITTTADSATAKRRKVVNDAVAYIRSLAEQRSRNADWAERAVREGVSLTAQQALAENVIDDIVDNPQALLATINGRTVSTESGERTLSLDHARIELVEPGWRTELLQIITNPTVAYLLFMIGVYGLILEALNPGSAVPGVIGGISLLCALYAFQVLPIDYAGLALLVLGVALMVAEMFAPSFGILGLGGIGAFVFGSIMLMDTDVPGFELPLGLIGGLAVGSALLLAFILYMFLRSRRKRIWTGREGLIGQTCTAVEDFDDRQGWVLLQGESWLAESNTRVRKDDRLVVTAVDGLKVSVRLATTDAKPSATA